MDKRTLLAVVLSIVVLFIYQNFFVKTPDKETDGSRPAAGGPSSPDRRRPNTSRGGGETAAPPATLSQTTGRMVAAKAVTGTDRDVVVATSLYRAVFTTRGAALKSFQLKQYQTVLKTAKTLWTSSTA